MPIVLAGRNGTSPGGGVGDDERRQVVAGSDPAPVERLAAERLDVQHAPAPAVVVDEPHRGLDRSPHLRRHVRRRRVEGGDERGAQLVERPVVDGDDERVEVVEALVEVARVQLGGVAHGSAPSSRTNPPCPSSSKAASSSNRRRPARRSSAGTPTHRPRRRCSSGADTAGQRTVWSDRWQRPLPEGGLVGQRTISTNGVDLHVVEDGEPDADHAVVLVHGFPELSYSWRHQLPALAAAGHHVVAPDMRGYGRSTQPERIEDYDIVHLTDDLLGVLDDLGREQAVFVGHDWGALVVWSLALLHPSRVAGVVGMSVPFLPRAPMPPTQLMAPAVRRPLLLHPLLPAARTGRRRPRPRPGDDDAPPARRHRATRRAMTDPAITRRRRPRLRRPLPRTGRPAIVADAGRARPLRRRVHPHRLHRRAQLVPQPRPQLGA